MDTELAQKPKNLSVQEAAHVAPRRPELDPAWKKCLSAFAVFFVVVVVSWLQDDSPVRRAMTTYTWPAMVFFEWVQHWSLFSPDVRNMIYHENAIITFEDGTAQLYEFPRTQKMDQWERFRREKLRKFFLDNVIWTSMNWGWSQPPVCRYLAKSTANATNQPEQVIMFKNENVNPPPDPKNWTYLNQLPEHIHKSITRVYSVNSEDLAGSGQETTSTQRLK